jgi:hypothetical protein
MWIGLLASQAIWMVAAFFCVYGAVFLYREKVISEKWFLFVPYLVASVIYVLLRYRLPLYFTDARSLDTFFQAGSFVALERWVFFLLLPIFYAVSVLRPDWVVKMWVNYSLIFLSPLALKLFLLLTGLVPWEDLSHQVVPERIL